MIVDGYYYALENLDARQMAILDSDVQYISRQFDRATYERARAKSFESSEAAYYDWVHEGRRLGLEYAPGKNTYLKIILKAKDEPELIEAWIDHHARIVGDHNLVILDCGSKDEAYLSILEKYKSRILILSYRMYYDSIHAVAGNSSFFRAISRNCKYLTILDADEFLVYYKEGRFRNADLIEFLESSDVAAFAGTWIYNCESPAFEAGKVSFRDPVVMTVSKSKLVHGTHSGKSIIKSSSVSLARHIGHNMHVGEVRRLLRDDSFGKFYIFHLAALRPDIVCWRIARHLFAKGEVPAGTSSLEAIFELLKLKKDSGEEFSRSVVGYAEKFMSVYSGGSAVTKGEIFEVDMSSLWDCAAPPNFQVEAENFDFVAFSASYSS